MRLPFHQEIECYRWSGIDEPPETRRKDKERGRKRKVLNSKNLEGVLEGGGGENKRGMPWGFKGICAALLQRV